jgi:hypothetical protein
MQEDHQFEANLGYTEKNPILGKKKNTEEKLINRNSIKI